MSLLLYQFLVKMYIVLIAYAWKHPPKEVFPLDIGFLIHFSVSHFYFVFGGTFLKKPSYKNFRAAAILGRDCF